MTELHLSHVTPSSGEKQNMIPFGPSFWHRQRNLVSECMIHKQDFYYEILVRVSWTENLDHVPWAFGQSVACDCNVMLNTGARYCALFSCRPVSKQSVNSIVAIIIIAKTRLCCGSLNCLYNDNKHTSLTTIFLGNLNVPQTSINQSIEEFVMQTVVDGSSRI